MSSAYLLTNKISANPLMISIRGIFLLDSYCEIRISASDREGNRTNGLIVVYTEETKKLIVAENKHECSVCNKETIVNTILNFDNLCRKNMMNVKDTYKKNKCANVYDSDDDSYCTLVSLEKFKTNYEYYIKKPSKKEIG